MAATQESEEDVLDWSNQGLKKLCKPSGAQSKVSKLILDNNDLTRLDCIDSFTALKSLSAVRNGLLRMYNVTRLHHLVSLNLARNGILTIEGLKEATQLKWLCLAGNNIKTIEHLNTNSLLEHIDLSENNIAFITDLSHLTNLKTLLLNSNKIGHLQACDKFLPVGLDTVALAANNITDLNQVSFLVNLRDLRQLSIANNPCVAMTGMIDGFMVNEIESLKAEWLYSQGRGRQFRPGDHESLVAYLASTCPLGGESLETEEDRKLRLILSKAQHHQQQLKQQQADGTLQRSSSVSPFTRRRTSNSYNRSSLNRGRRRTYTPDRMTSSFHSELPSSGPEMSPLMTQSLDLSFLNSSDSDDSRRKVPSQLVPQDEDSPLHSATEMIPVPDSLLSPEFRPIDMIPLGTPAQTPATPATPATPSCPLAKKGIAQPLATGLPRPSSARPSSRLPVRAEANLERDGKQSEAVGPKMNGGKKEATDTHADMNGKEQSCISQKLNETPQFAPSKPMQRSDAKRPTSLGIFPIFTCECAATNIQRLWRGYHARNLDPRVAKVNRCLQDKRTLEHIRKLTEDLEGTKSALEGERRLQLLQMQAISALWKKVVSLQQNSATQSILPTVSAADLLGSEQVTSSNSAECIRKLTHSCLHLHTQVAELQQSMQEVTAALGLTYRQGQIPRVTLATQTDLSAVHTPSDAVHFPFQKGDLPITSTQDISMRPASAASESGSVEKAPNRPSSLPLNAPHPSSRRQTPPQLNHFASSLLDGVMRTVSSTDQGNENALDESSSKQENLSDTAKDQVK
ncbi:hypothetical protein FOCC_FOCC007964 [Frankliniella occidentalis]|nr:hypothetical protein FOCC_FOCC007964 [Frankliniella occidentalis]